MGAGYFRLDEHRGGSFQLGRGEEGNFSNRAELGAACLALEDAKRIQDRKPVILLSDSACFLSSSQKWIGEGKSPHRGDPLNELADRWQMKVGKAKIFDGPSQRTDPSSTGLTMT